jgi:hypothetical protein
LDSAFWTCWANHSGCAVLCKQMREDVGLGVLGNCDFLTIAPLYKEPAYSFSWVYAG